MTSTKSALVVSRRQAVDRTLVGLKLLPSNAAVAMKVLDLKRRGDASAADLARVISTDAALASKILALANSSAFSPAAPITRLSIAIAQIGFANLLPLVFGLSVAGTFSKLALPAEDQAQFWRSALLKAVTARTCVRRLGLTFQTSAEREVAAEEAFLAALFQDIALPIFSAADRSSWPELLAALDAPENERRAREESLYGVDHGSIGAGVAQLLGLPELLVSLIRTHHDGVATITAAGAGALAVAVDAAASLPHRIPSFSAKILNALTIRLSFTAKCSATEVAAVARDIADDYTKTSALFDKPEDATASYKEFLQNLSAEVAECLQSSIMSSAIEIGGLKEHKRRLGDAVAALEDKNHKAEYDALTKVLTRSAFIARLEKLLPMARRHGASCVVGFLDLDNFKGINDGHGHACGDAALSAAAALLLTTLKSSGIAGRIGGDEFVFAFVTRPEVSSSAVDSLISRMTRVAFVYENVPLAVTTSIGVLRLGIPDEHTNAERAMHAADQLMYQAKRAGKARGAVGVHSTVPDAIADTAGLPITAKSTAA